MSSGIHPPAPPARSTVLLREEKTALDTRTVTTRSLQKLDRRWVSGGSGVWIEKALGRLHMDAQAREGLRGVPGVAGRSALFKLNPRPTMRLRERLRCKRHGSLLLFVPLEVVKFVINRSKSGRIRNLAATIPFNIRFNPETY